jgi:adenylate kinase
MQNIIIFGPPGSGKGTQSKKLMQNYDLRMLATGDLLRSEVASGSELGKLCKAIMDDGKFPSDQIVCDLAKKFLSDTTDTRGVLFDGFPRTIAQADFLRNFLTEGNSRIDCVIDLVVSEQVLMQRILGRYFCKGCGEIYNKFYKRTLKENVCDVCSGNNFYHRSDDNETTVATRLKVYRELTFPILKFLKDKGTQVVEINGAMSEEDVYTHIATVLN